MGSSNFVRLTVLIGVFVIMFVDRATAAALPATIDFNSGDEDVLLYGETANDQLGRAGGQMLGDLNGDGIEDLVVGALGADGPSEARSSAGEVYIIFGGASVGGTRDVGGTSGTTPDVRIYAASAGDGVTQPRIGDVNGDGIADLVLVSATADGPSESRTDAGEVYIIYGSSSLPSTIDIANGEEDVLVYSDILNAVQFSGGQTLADINGDGIEDLIFGFSGGDGPTGTRTDAGQITVVYGSSSLPSVIDMATYLPSANGLIVYGATAGDHLISTQGLAAGDVNGDGIEDLVFGAGEADGPSDARPNAGEAYVIFGSASLPQTIDLGSNEEDVTIYGATSGDFLTGTYFYIPFLVVEDLNGDGIDDISLSASYADGPGDARGDAGEAYVIYGSASLPSVIDLASSDEDVTIYGASAGDGLQVQGYTSLGDFNADGINDLLLGSQLADGPSEGRASAGEAYIILGTGSFPSTIDLASNDEDVTIYGATAGDGLNEWTPASYGDLNGDGFDDVLLGAPYADGPLDGRGSAGEQYIIYGSATPPSTIDLNSSDEDVTIYGATASDQLSRIVSNEVGDMNGDGFTDFAMGAYSADGPGDARGSAGEAYVVFGDTLATSATVKQCDHSGNPLPEQYGATRVAIDYADGTISSITTVTLTRSDSAISNLGDGSLSDVADAMWQISTTRTGFTSAIITIHYVDSEIASLTESKIRLYKASSPSGPWTQVATQTTNTMSNTLTATVTGFSYFALLSDTDAPIVSSITRDDSNPTNAASIDFTVEFSEPVTGVDSSDFALTTSGIAGASITGVSGGGTSYTVTATTGTGDGTIRLDLSDDDSIVDGAANVLGGAGAGNGDFSSGETYTTDKTAPTATLSSVVLDPTNVSPIPVSVTFNESVAGFDSGDIVTVNAVVGNFAGVGAGYTFDLTPSGQGAVTADIAGGVCVDTAGNPNTAAVQFSRTFDSVAPTVTIGAPSASITSAAPVSYTVTYGGADSVTLANGDVTLNTTGTATGVVGVSGSGTASRTVTISGITGNGTLGISIGLGSASDAAGNAAAATGPSAVVAVDTVAPAVESVAVMATKGPMQDFLVTFSEAVGGADVSDFAMTTTGSITGGDVVDVTGTAFTATYIVTVDTGTGSGTIRLDVIDNDTIVDEAGNPLGGPGVNNGDFTAGEVYSNATPVPATTVFALALLALLIPILYSLRTAVKPR